MRKTLLNQLEIKLFKETQAIINLSLIIPNISLNVRFPIYQNFSLIFSLFQICQCMQTDRIFLTNTEWNIITESRSNLKKTNSFSRHLSVKWFLQLTPFLIRKEMPSKSQSLIQLLRKRSRLKVPWKDK